MVAHDYGEIPSRNLVKMGEEALVSQKKTEEKEDKDIFKYGVNNLK